MGSILETVEQGLGGWSGRRRLAPTPDRQPPQGIRKTQGPGVGSPLGSLPFLDGDYYRVGTEVIKRSETSQDLVVVYMSR
jgi:hypothetical protein